MRKSCLTIATALFLFFSSNGIYAQNVSSNLDQSKLILQFLGKWQRDVGKDTVEVWDMQLYGKAFTSNVSLLIKGKNYPVRMEHSAYVPEENRFRAFQIYYNGGYLTWIGYFTSEKKFSVNFMENFDQSNILINYELVFETPNKFTMTQFTKDGVKVMEFKYTKVK
jgi:hypothetical protein